MKIIVCNRCGKQITRGEGVKFKMTYLWDESISKAHLCDKCFKEFQNFYYKEEEHE